MVPPYSAAMAAIGFHMARNNDMWSGSVHLANMALMQDKKNAKLLWSIEIELERCAAEDIIRVPAGRFKSGF